MGDIVLGIVGAYISGLIVGGGLMVTGFNLEGVVAFLGAVVLIAVSRMFSGQRGVLTR